MKELIEIPNSNVIANTESCFGISFDGMDYQKIIMGGTPIPDNATNGDMIKAMFNPCRIFKYTSDVQVYFSERYYQFFGMSWWNAPYEVEE
jgi:hypothetical protein